ncbi:MAG: VWA domain-containing protein, partial [Lachnospiraceae bacterium]|nr:VWA domain-containing protein [Lachnospiraceae bacterium]
MDIVFVIDSSGSMSTNDRGGVRKRVTNEFIQKLTEKDRAAVIQFATSAVLLSPLTADKDVLTAAVNRIESYGLTNLSSGITMAINQFQTSLDTETERRKCIIMLTDGDGSYNSSLTQTAAARGIVIYTVGLGSSVSSSLLTSIAIGTGGSYYHANNVNQLYGIFDSIADQSDLGKDTDGDGLNDYYEKEICSGNLRLGTGVRLTGLNYQNPDTDNDGLKDGAEIKVTKNGDKITVLMLSNPTKADTDDDGYPDPIDPYPLYPDSYKYLGDEKYFNHLDKTLIYAKKESWKYGSSASSFIAGEAVKIMMIDYYKYRNPDGIPDSYWDKYCNQFNSYVRGYGSVYMELHYFRNNLNRAPSSLQEMINTITSASGATWRLLPVEKSLYHMYGENGEYNLKFVSDDGKYEGVYDKNGTELTEVNDPINMGTYNYADPSNVLEHTYFDVLPYGIPGLAWGNTRDSVRGCKQACVAAIFGYTKDKFKQNNDAKSYRSQIEDRIQ